MDPLQRQHRPLPHPRLRLPLLIPGRVQPPRRRPPRRRQPLRDSGLLPLLQRRIPRHRQRGPLPTLRVFGPPPHGQAALAGTNGRRRRRQQRKAETRPRYQDVLVLHDLRRHRHLNHLALDRVRPGALPPPRLQPKHQAEEGRGGRRGLLLLLRRCR